MTLAACSLKIEPHISILCEHREDIERYIERKILNFYV